MLHFMHGGRIFQVATAQQQACNIALKQRVADLGAIMCGVQQVFRVLHVCCGQIVQARAATQIYRRAQVIIADFTVVNGVRLERQRISLVVQPRPVVVCRTWMVVRVINALH